jgi:hypothetical protein
MHEPRFPLTFMFATIGIFMLLYFLSFGVAQLWNEPQVLALIPDDFFTALISIGIMSVIVGLIAAFIRIGLRY